MLFMYVTTHILISMPQLWSTNARINATDGCIAADTPWLISRWLMVNCGQTADRQRYDTIRHDTVLSRYVLSLE